MQHKGSKEIETKRLILRPFRMEDDIYMYNNWANDNEVTHFLRWPTHSSVEVSRKLLSEWIPKYENNDYYSWAIELKSISEPIGSIMVVRQREHLKLMEIGYWVGKKWWNQGFASEALGAIVHFLICEVGANRIQASHDTRNPGSGRVMEKCGLKYEGTMRQSDINNQGIFDCALYAIIADDYKGLQACLSLQQSMPIPEIDL